MVGNTDEILESDAYKVYHVTTRAFGNRFKLDPSASYAPSLSIPFIDAAMFFSDSWAL